MNKPNINAMWDYVKERYPDARFDFWYRSGELHFWPTGEAEERGDYSYGCVVRDGEFTILTEF